MRRLVVFGLGYSGRAIAQAAVAAGWEVVGTSRGVVPAPAAAPDRGAEAGIAVVPFDAAAAAIASATHVVVTVPPSGSTRTPGALIPAASQAATATGRADAPDPVLALYAAALRAAPALRWIGYLSSTVVYGDRGGDWVNEASPPAPSQDRGHRRLGAERGWEAFADRCAVDIFRLAGIYGRGRCAFDDLRAGRARRMIKAGHQFGRIHRDDIARAVLAAMRQDRPPSRRVLNLSDDEPSESATVVTEAAALLGCPLPPEIRFEDALPTMSPMAQSFWAENRKVSSAATKAALRIAWLYPTYRQGLRAILAEERANGPA